jgi:hypothetical protein
MLLGNSNLWLNFREIQINSVLLIGQLELFITKNRLYPVLFFKRYCFQLSPRKTHCKFDPRVLGHPVYTGVPELAPQRKQACADNKRDSKLTKINFLLAQITEL